jgi:hypothetical protein
MIDRVHRVAVLATIGLGLFLLIVLVAMWAKGWFG